MNIRDRQRTAAALRVQMSSGSNRWHIVLRATSGETMCATERTTWARDA